MYLVGADHPNKHRVRQLLRRFAAQGEVLVTDAEVFQEILHRYAAIQRREAIGPAFRVVRDLVEEILPIEWEDVRAAKAWVEGSELSARNALHVAVMQRHEVSRILSFDRGFDAVDSLVRLD